MSEMSFAQALNEARQIIVQQSNRIKADLDRIKALQETIAAQTNTIAEADRNLKQKVGEFEALNEQIKTLTTKLDEANATRQQSDALIDRQGQRLTQLQQSINDLEKQLGEYSDRAKKLSEELEAAKHGLPTQEDTEALAALASLLAAKKGASAPPAPRPHEENPAAAA